MDGGVGRYVVGVILWALFYVVVVVACIFCGRAAWDFYETRLRPIIRPATKTKGGSGNGRVPRPEPVQAES